MKLSELQQQKTSKTKSPLFKLERKLNLKLLLIFSAISAVLLFVSVALFPVLDDVLLKLQQMFADNAEFAKTISDIIGSQNIASYFVSQAGQTWALIGAVYASYLGYKLVCGNFKDGSYEMLYTQNLSRNQILLHKLLRLVINLLIFSFINAVAGVVALAIWGYGEFNLLKYLLYTLFVTITIIQIGVFSFAIATFAHKKYSVMASILVVITMYFVSMFAMSTTSLGFFNCLTPFALSFVDVFNETIKAVNVVSVIVWTVAPAVLAFLGFKNFKNSDLV